MKPENIDKGTEISCHNCGLKVGVFNRLVRMGEIMSPSHVDFYEGISYKTGDKFICRDCGMHEFLFLFPNGLTHVMLGAPKT